MRRPPIDLSHPPMSRRAHAGQRIGCAASVLLVFGIAAIVEITTESGVLAGSLLASFLYLAAILLGLDAWVIFESHSRYLRRYREAADARHMELAGLFEEEVSDKLD